MAERATDRFVRLVGLVSFLEASGPVPVDELARHFGVTAKQILADVDTLWVSGTPGYWPDDLIDFDADSYDRGVVHLTEARGMTRPLRLGTREGIALIAALRALHEAVSASGDDEQAGVVESALTKLTVATGDAASALDVRVTVDASREVLAAIRSATTTGRRLLIDYVDGSDVTTRRVVEPFRLVPSDDVTYLHAWCLDAQGERTFRTDRILAAEVVDEPATRTASPAAASRAYRPAGDSVVELVLSAQARWIAEQVPVESVTNIDETRFAVTLRVANPAWLRLFLLRNASRILSVGPEEVREDVAVAARLALAEYESLGLLDDEQAAGPPSLPAPAGAGA
ncbi:predicted transcriptional regulator [Sanguibacter keddieii DSM 10542]|uniref:Predicted transcriptional regulator n=1 Tax=Sanguibacter keddieii (strain ATCC 51767 / DSM 10542 / NCFB 3025 / ST-74) TaxID=446469 RepID=D1BH61_SANKS|nr:WYL domain-containing protein [Sanguibacter keddieii]ACZ21781.1 predicted transcriptional regulator [Sanguibacter keddieii DSM 10542]